MSELQATLQVIAALEHGPFFVGKPERWWDNPHWRCLGGHVSISYLKSEASGPLCLICRHPAALTFPEDADGPLDALSGR